MSHIQDYMAFITDLHSVLWWPQHLQRRYTAHVWELNAASAKWYCAVITMLHMSGVVDAWMSKSFMEGLIFIGLAASYWFGPAQVAWHKMVHLGSVWLAANASRISLLLGYASGWVPCTTFCAMTSKIGADPSATPLAIEALMYGAYQQVTSWFVYR